MKSPLLLAIPILLCAFTAGASIHIVWDPATTRLLQPGATYGRMHRLADGAILCCFEKSGRPWVMRSGDQAESWTSPVQVADFAAGTAANPELCPLRDGRVLLFWNERPRRDGSHPFTIRMSTSRDGGLTWQARPDPVFTAGNTRRTACWEPAAIEAPDGRLRLLFSRELPDGQEITTTNSRDGGATWSRSRRASFRPDHRDGMPVPTLLESGRLVFSIEDNGLGGGDRKRFRPAIVDAETGRRWPALATPPGPDSTLAAPYLARLPTGETLLSVQRSTDDNAPKQMAVYIGRPDATRFANPSLPLDLRPQRDCLWNALFPLDHDRLIALSNTRIDGRSGLWCVSGRIVRTPATSHEPPPGGAIRNDSRNRPLTRIHSPTCSVHLRYGSEEGEAPCEGRASTARHCRIAIQTRPERPQQHSPGQRPGVHVTVSIAP